MIPVSTSPLPARGYHQQNACMVGMYLHGLAGDLAAKELGKLLIKGFIYTSSEYDKLPKTIVFFNSGVKLTTEGSPCLDDLEKLQDNGVEIISCGTCLDYYGLKEKLKVGEISNMYTIYETLFNAGKVINI